MSDNYKAPGLYIKEVSTGPRPIESVATSVLGIIGFVPAKITSREIGAAQGTQKSTPSGPTLVSNWTEFTGKFGTPEEAVNGGYLHAAMSGYFLNGGRPAYVVGISVLPPPAGEFKNQQSKSALRVTSASPLEQGTTIQVALEPPQAGDAPQPPSTGEIVVTRTSGEASVVHRTTIPIRDMKRTTIKEAIDRQQDLRLVVELLEGVDPLDKGTITLQPITNDTANIEITTDIFLKYINDLETAEDVTLLACPDVLYAFKNSEPNVQTVQQAMITHCEKMKDRIALLEMPEDADFAKVQTWLVAISPPGNDKGKYAAMYYPWIKVSSGAFVPPSGHIAGVYARVDSERGVHKAPANEVVWGATGLRVNVTGTQQGPFNEKGINCIRAFPGQGIRVWGARTLDTSEQWRYINVRRLFCHIEDSILQSTRWVVFEPNDAILWAAIRRDLNAYLTRLWRDGALLGRTPAEAFYVKCDEETNPPDVIQQGYCVIEVGIAPVRPAEFVVFQVGQWEGGGSATESQATTHNGASVTISR